MNAKKTIIKSLGVIVAVVLIGAVLFRLWWFSKPVVNVDYHDQFKEMREPEGYSYNDDGRKLFVGASTAISSPTQHLYLDRSMADMNDAERAEVRRWLADNKAVLELFEKAMAKKYILLWPEWMEWPVAATIYFPYTSSTSGMGNLLIWRGKMEAWDGDVKGGIADVLAAAKISKHFGSSLTWFEWKDGVGGAAACCQAITDIVKWAKLSDAELAALSIEVQEISSQWEDNIEWPLAFQRLLFLDMVQRTFTDDGHGDGRVIPAVLSKMWAGHYGSRMESFLFTTIIALRQPGKKATIECYDRVAQACKEQWGKTPPEPYKEPVFMDAIAHVGPPRVSWAKIAAGNAVVRNYLPGDEKSFSALYFKRRETSRTLATIAVARYRASTGHLPDTLADVVNAGYLKEIPHAWLSNEPFIYEKKGDSFVIYISNTEKERVEEDARLDAEWKKHLADPNNNATKHL